MKKILKKYCFKYLLVFLLILGACVPVAVVSYRVMKEQVMETSQWHLEEGTNQLNRFLEQMTAIVRSSEQDPYVKQMSLGDCETHWKREKF